MPFDLRDYQINDIKQIRAAFAQFRRVLYGLATGGGKTVLASASYRCSQASSTDPLRRHVPRRRQGAQEFPGCRRMASRPADQHELLQKLELRDHAADVARHMSG